MRLIKSLGTAILSLLLTLGVGLLVLSVIFTQLLAQPTAIKANLDKADVHQSFVDTVAEQVGEQADEIAVFDRAELEGLVRDSLSAAAVQTEFENAIDATYAWLEGETDTPKFVLDFSEARESFARNAGQHMQQQLEALPACTSLARLPASGSIENLTCLPPGYNTETEVDQYMDSALASDDFFADATVSSDELLGGKDVFSEDSPAPTVFQLLANALWPLVGALLLGGAGIVILAKNKRIGLRRVAWQLIGAGTGFLLLAALGWLWLWTEPVVFENTSTVFQDSLINAALSLVYDALIIIGALAGGFLVAGILIRILIRKKPQTKQ